MGFLRNVCPVCMGDDDDDDDEDDFCLGSYRAMDVLGSRHVDENSVRGELRGDQPEETQKTGERDPGAPPTEGGPRECSDP